MLDNLARGRFDFGVGKGVRPGEFAQLGIKFEDGVAMTEEAIEILLKVVDARAHQPRGPVLELSRAQPAAPRLLSARIRRCTRWRAGRSRWPASARAGWPVAMHFTPDRRRRPVRRGVSGGDRPAARTRRESVRTGRGCCCAARPMWPRRPRSARAEGAAGAPGLLASLVPGRAAAARRVLRRASQGADGSGMGRADLRRARGAIGGFLIGAPDQVAAEVEQLEAIGVDTLLLVCSFGALSHAQVCRIARAVRRRRHPATADPRPLISGAARPPRSRRACASR